MRIRTLSLAVALAGALAGASARGAEEDFIWQSDQGLQQAAAVAPEPAKPGEPAKLPAPAVKPVPRPAADAALPEDPAYKAPAKKTDPFRPEGNPTPSPSDKPAPPAPAAPAKPAAAAEPCLECEEAADDEPWRLFKPRFLEDRRITVRGWIEQGYTWNPDYPDNRYNGPVTFNDRANEYQLNQAYLITERLTDTACRDIDIGGRVDLLYGTDHRFVMANGLEYETNADGSLERTWNRNQRFYGLAMPQAYADLAFRDWVFRFGRFYTVAGYETPMAVDNFFYSHSYTFQYGEPFTHTGMLAKWKLNDRFSLSAGFHRGWDQFEDNNDKLGFLGAINWTSESEATNVALSLVSSDEQNVGDGTRNLVSFVWTQKLAERWKYVFQSDFGHEQDVLPRGQDAEWYGVVNYLYYDLNPCWSFGARYEWFNDDDGVRVLGASPDIGGLAINGVASHWQEISVGLNYKPGTNVLLRSELRWDWVDPHSDLVADGPYDDFSDRSQFLWGTDLIVRF